MTQDITFIEKEAQQLLLEQKYQEAGDLYFQTARTLQKEEKHDQAAICLAAAASSLALMFGQQTFQRIAYLYEEAAREAEASRDLEYAAMLYKYAAVSYERDHDYHTYSECFFKSKESYRRFLFFNLFCASKKDDNVEIKFNLKLVAKRLPPLVALTFSSLIWGHGERPHRTVVFGFLLILACAFLYTYGHLTENSITLEPNLFQATYFSFTTFTKVGAEDMIPVGFNKAIAVIEAFIGLFTFPIFITGLCRKYLRF